jgi:hypothetical protein
MTPVDSLELAAATQHLSLLVGLVSDADVVAWADARIAADSDPPPAWLTDVAAHAAFARRRDWGAMAETPRELTSILSDAACDADRCAVAPHVLRALRASFGHRSSEEVVVALTRLVGTGAFSDTVEDEIRRLEDALELVDFDIETPVSVRRAITAFLDAHAASTD